jgi:hypothetical protein
MATIIVDSFQTVLAQSLNVYRAKKSNQDQFARLMGSNKTVIVQTQARNETLFKDALQARLILNSSSRTMNERANRSWCCIGSVVSQFYSRTW